MPGQAQLASLASKPQLTFIVSPKPESATMTFDLEAATIANLYFGDLTAALHAAPAQPNPHDCVIEGSSAANTSCEISTG